MRQRQGAGALGIVQGFLRRAMQSIGAAAPDARQKQPLIYKATGFGNVSVLASAELPTVSLKSRFRRFRGKRTPGKKIVCGP